MKRQIFVLLEHAQTRELHFSTQQAFDAHGLPQDMVKQVRDDIANGEVIEVTVGRKVYRFTGVERIAKAA